MLLRQIRRLPSLPLLRPFSRRDLSFSPSEPLKVLVGTQTGTAMGFALNLQDAASQRGLSNVQVLDLDEFPPEELSKEKQLILIMACYGAGEPTDNAKRFYEALMAEKGKTLAGVSYTVFGLGSSKTHQQNYNVIAKKVDRKMEESGARRVFSLGLGDDSGCIEVDFQKWQDALLDEIINPKPEEGKGEPTATPPPPPPSSSEVRPPSPAAGPAACPAEPAFSLILSTPAAPPASATHQLGHLLRQGGFYKPSTVAFPVLSNGPLNPAYPDSMLEMRLGSPVPLDPSTPGSPPAPFSYQTGDHIGIYPRNDPAVVSRLAARCGYPLDQVISFGSPRGAAGSRHPFPSGITVREALSSCLELESMPKPAGIGQLAQFAQSPEERARLEAMARNPETYKQEVWRANRHLPDLLDEFSSVQLPLPSLLQVAPALQPRFYSIASSALEHPAQVHLTYRWVHYTSATGVARQGVATQFLRGLQGGGEHHHHHQQQVYGYIRTSSFRQPEDPSAPVVMIAGGSGIAPLKAFLQERLFLARTQGRRYGPGILLFGVRSPEDLVYEALIRECLSAGALTAAHLSFSSQPPTPGSYTPKFVAQDIREQSRELWRCIADGGSLYLCGGASAFAQTCGAELRRMIQKEGRLDAQGAEDYFFSLIRQKRYQEDLAD